MKLLLLLSLSLFSLRAEVANAPCEMSFDVTGSTTSSATIDNTAKGCVLWYFTLTNTGSGGTAIAVQFSNDNTTFTSSGATYTLTDGTTGTFPVTITSTAKLAGNFQDFGRYARVTLTTSASTSHAIGTLKGYYNIAKGGTSGGGGGTYTAGTGLQLVGSEFSINSAVTQTKATDQAGTSRYCTSSTGNDTYTCTMTPTVSSYPAGMCVTLTADTANTGAASINIDTVGAASILSQSGGALSDNDITAGKPKIICSDGTNFIIQGDGGGGGSSYYQTIQDETSALTQRATVNFTGPNVTCADNSGSSRTDCTVGNTVATTQEGYLFPLDMNADVNAVIAASNETLYWQFVSNVNITVSKIFVYQAGNGVGASTGMAMAIYDQSGNLLQQTDTLDPTTGGAVRKTFTLAAAVTLQASKVYYLAFSCSCSTSPTMYQAVGNATTMRFLLNWDTNPRIFYANDTTGTTTLTFPATIGTRTVQTIYPVGVMLVP